MQIIPWGTYYDKLVLSLAYGDAPDVFICHANRIAEFARYGVFRPLDDLIEADKGFTPSDFLPNIWRAGQYEGKQVGLPLDCHPQGLYYNLKLFREAGIVDAQGNPKPPDTWEEFLDAARRLTKDKDGDGRPDQWGFAFTWLRTNWITFISQHGGSILSPGLKRATLAEPPAVRATQQMCDTITRYGVAPKPEGFDSWMGFRQGRVAMAIEGIYMLSSVEEQKGAGVCGRPGTVLRTRAGSVGWFAPVVYAQKPLAAAGAAGVAVHALPLRPQPGLGGGRTDTRPSLVTQPAALSADAGTICLRQTAVLRGVRTRLAQVDRNHALLRCRYRGCTAGN